VLSAVPLLFVLGACAGSSDSPFGIEHQLLTCANAGCGQQLSSAALPGPSGPVTIIAWSNSPQLGTWNDCDPTNCAGASPITAGNGQLTYGCPWQCVELVMRYFEGTWSCPKVYANADLTLCQGAASSSMPQYHVYGQGGASTAGHAPVAGDALVWNGHTALVTNSMSPGTAGTMDILEQNAACSGHDGVGWDGSMFGAKYGLGALCWIHVVANQGVTGPTCPTGGSWHLAGDYCGDEPGMSSCAANTLYTCSAEGGPASVKQVCPDGCQHMPTTKNDVCAAPPGPDAASAGTDAARIAPDAAMVSLDANASAIDGGSARADAHSVAGDANGNPIDAGARPDAARVSDAGSADVVSGCHCASAGDAAPLAAMLVAILALPSRRRRCG
jgi:MYXO-CTERM domain-containing protein